MAGTTTSSSPSWAQESLAVLAARRRLATVVVLVLAVLSIIVTLVAPGVLPANALVGAAVAVAALLLGLAAVLAADAADLVVRGVRHLHAAGADVSATVSSYSDDVHALLAVVGRHARGGRVRVGIVSASRTAGAPGARAAALALALARTGKRVLLTDLTRGASGAAGLSDVIAGTHRLRDVVHFDTGVFLGRVAVGSDPAAALAGYDEWLGHLPSDLEVLVTVLPPLAEPLSLRAATSMDVVFLQVELDRTERVDLLASLDALDAVHQRAEIVLVDPRRPGVRPDGLDDTDARDGTDDTDAREVDHGDDADAAAALAADDVEQAEPFRPAVVPTPDTADEVDGDAPEPVVAEDAPTIVPEQPAAPTPRDDDAPIEDVTAADDAPVVPAASPTVDLVEDDPEPTREIPVPTQATVDVDRPSFAPVRPASSPDRWLDPREVWSDRPASEAATTGDGTATREHGGAAGTAVDVVERDDLTDEAVRTAAALQSLAQQVWSRGD